MLLLSLDVDDDDDVHLSNVNDLTLVMCVLNYRCLPEQFIHKTIPKSIDAHVGSTLR